MCAAQFTWPGTSRFIERRAALFDGGAEIRIAEFGVEDQVNRSFEELLKFFPQSKEGSCVSDASSRFERDKEVEVAVLGVELIGRRGTEQVEPQHMVSAA